MPTLRKIKKQIGVCEPSRGISNNGLRANEGRETNALNCKPNTNLKEKYELSNYCKTSGFLLHAVIGCSAHSQLQNTNCLWYTFLRGRVWW